MSETDKKKAKDDINRYRCGKDRYEQIVSAARELYEDQGIADTSISDVTNYLGITRSLFYHYFDDKEALTEAVLNDYVEDFVNLVHTWSGARDVGAVSEAVSCCIKILRKGIFENERFSQDKLSQSEGAGLFLNFSDHVVETLAVHFAQATSTVNEKYYNLKSENLYEVFYIIFSGIIAYMRRYPDAPDEVLEDLIIDALRLTFEAEPIRTADQS
ncbi:MAG: TetR/AcrR family transcriptional regulator [Eggerthellaceae bacterium]|jgi:TetR/AcrR family transcriptional regulator